MMRFNTNVVSAPTGTLRENIQSDAEIEFNGRVIPGKTHWLSDSDGNYVEFVVDDDGDVEVTEAVGQWTNLQAAVEVN